MTSAMAITKIKLATFLHPQFRFYCVPTHDSRLFSLSILLMLQVCTVLKLKISIFPLITYFRAEYCAAIDMHSTVQGDKLLYGHVPDPFPRYRIGSGHARLPLSLPPKLFCIICKFRYSYMQYQTCSGNHPPHIRLCISQYFYLKCMKNVYTFQITKS